MTTPVVFQPVRAGAEPFILHRPSLAEVLALNGDKLPPIAGAGRNEWVALVNSAQQTIVPIAYKESVTLTSISPGGNTEAEGALILPSDYVVPGSIIRWTARGWVSNTATPTLELSLLWGGTAGVVLAARKVTMATVTAESSWSLEATSRVVSVATEATKSKIITQGTIKGMLIAEAESTGVTTVNIPITKPQTEVAVVTTKPQALTLGAKWGTSSASNTITCTQWLVEVLN